MGDFFNPQPNFILGKAVLPRILLIELSATIRHIEKNLLIKSGYEVVADFDFNSALHRFKPGSDDGGAFDAVVLGWPDQNHPGGGRTLYITRE